KPHPEDIAQPALETIFGFLPRVALGSLLAYIISQTLDVYVYSWIRRLFPSDRALWLRNSGSTAVSQLLDTFIFTSVAFIGKYPFDVWVQIFITTYVLKFVVALFAAPYAYAAKRITPMDEGGEKDAG
ncbi:queuosine precursor transporter, partial [Bacillus sp. JJ675]